MTLSLAKIIWALGCVAWFAIRWPHQRRAWRTPVVARRERARDTLLMAISLTGLFLVPLIYATTGAPRFAASCGWITRMAVSVGPPVANGITNSIGRVGYCCAAAGVAAATSMKSAMRKRISPP